MLRLEIWQERTVLGGWVPAYPVCVAEADVHLQRLHGFTLPVPDTASDGAAAGAAGSGSGPPPLDQVSGPGRLNEVEAPADWPVSLPAELAGPAELLDTASGGWRRLHLVLRHHILALYYDDDGGEDAAGLPEVEGPPDVELDLRRWVAAGQEDLGGEADGEELKLRWCRGLAAPPTAAQSVGGQLELVLRFADEVDEPGFPPGWESWWAALCRWISPGLYPTWGLDDGARLGSPQPTDGRSTDGSAGQRSPQPHTAGGPGSSGGLRVGEGWLRLAPTAAGGMVSPLRSGFGRLAAADLHLIAAFGAAAAGGATEPGPKLVERQFTPGGHCNGVDDYGYKLKEVGARQWLVNRQQVLCGEERSLLQWHRFLSFPGPELLALASQGGCWSAAEEATVRMLVLQGIPSALCCSHHPALAAAAATAVVTVGGMPLAAEGDQPTGEMGGTPAELRTAIWLALARRQRAAAVSPARSKATGRDSPGGAPPAAVC